MSARRLVLVAAAFFAVGFAAVWALGLSSAECGIDAREGSSAHVEPSAWPPGTSRCVVEEPDGTVRTERRVPWLEWLSLTFLAAAAGLAAAAWGSPRGRLGLAWAAAWLLLAACATHFDSALAGLVFAVPAAVPLLVRAVRGGGMRGAPG